MDPYFNAYFNQLQNSWMAPFQFNAYMNFQRGPYPQNMANVSEIAISSFNQAKPMNSQNMNHHIGGTAQCIPIERPSVISERFDFEQNLETQTSNINTEQIRYLKEYLQIYLDITGFVKIAELESRLIKYSDEIKEFDTIHPLLFSKYVLKGKTKEEKTKFVIRNAFKFCKNKIKEKHPVVCGKEIEKIFVQQNTGSKLMSELNEDIKKYKVPFQFLHAEKMNHLIK